MLEAYGRERGDRLWGRQQARRESKRERKQEHKKSTQVVRSRFKMLEEIFQQFQRPRRIRKTVAQEPSGRIQTRVKDRS